MTSVTVVKISNEISMLIKKKFNEANYLQKSPIKTLNMSVNVTPSNANCQTEEDQANSSQQNLYTCSSCSSCTFNTYRGLSQHTRFCAKCINVVSISSSQLVTISERAKTANVFSPVTSLMWGERDGTLFTDNLNETYQKIVLCRKNLLILPIGNNETKKSLDS